MYVHNNILSSESPGIPRNPLESLAFWSRNPRQIVVKAHGSVRVAYPLLREVYVQNNILSSESFGIPRVMCQGLAPAAVIVDVGVVIGEVHVLG